MKFCLISGKSGEDVKEVFVKEAKRIFDEVLSVSLNQVRVECDSGDVRLYHKERDLSEFDAIFVRVFNDDFLFAEVVLEAIEHLDVYTPGSLDGYQVTNHKFLSVERVARIGVPVPDSSLTVSPEASKMINHEMGFPVVLKLLRGFGGKGVVLVSSERDLKGILDTLKVFNEFLSSQKYIPNPGSDLRGLVIGDEVVGYKRQGAAGDFRANLSGGGKGSKVDLPDDMKVISRKVAELLDLDICAVDFIESDKGPIFIEANFTPGIYFLGEKGARMMLEMIKKKAEEKQ